MTETTAQDIAGLIRDARDKRQTVRIEGGASKPFYGRDIQTDTTISTAAHTGIVEYMPSELVITARAATPLSELESALAENGQQLPFEPPHFSGTATAGGMLAGGLSGPQRPYGGSVRDSVLGIKIINGAGDILNFGGQVMKNVAGYDVSRLFVGSLGTLGVVLQMSLKVIPRAPAAITLRHGCDKAAALDLMRKWARQPLPLSAVCWHDNALFTRLSGTPQWLEDTKKQLGGTQTTDFNWEQLREHQLPFFTEADKPLWRLSVRPFSALDDISDSQLIEWNGALHWYRGALPADQLHALAKRHGGHATCFRGEPRDEIFTPLDPINLRYHRGLKQAFDPAGILNPGRMYKEI